MRGFLRLVAVCAVGVAFGMGQVAKGPVTPAVAADAKGLPSAGRAHALEAADVEAFFDGMVPLQLERSDIAGASVLVMQDGRVLLEKGYGVADVKSGRAVDPVSTIFRLASISKLFTWVSVMQLEEQGKLDLDADVNQYLDFHINAKFGKPVTLRELMTHTSGFEEQSRDVIVLNPKSAVTLERFMKENQPEELHAPGTVSAYSNYGVGLAGYIVQRVSGERYEGYVARHIFEPLGMVHSTFQQPPQTDLAKLPSEGYRGDTTKPKVGFEIFNPVPAGGISSTAADMGRFGQALLNGGELDGQRILKAETLKRMWTPQFRANKAMPPICMGFYEEWRNGVHWIGHEGDLIAFHSLFFVQPERKLTLFVSYNSAGSRSKARPEVISLFTDRYFPGYAARPVITETRAELNEIEGVYGPTRRADSTVLRLEALGEQQAATVDKDGSLGLSESKDLKGHPRKWKPVAKDLWQEVDGQSRIFAIRDGSGQVVRLATDFAGSQWERMPWYDRGGFVMAVGLGSIVVLWAAVLGPVFRVGYRLVMRRRLKPAPQPGTVWLPKGTWVSAALWVLPLTALLVWFDTQGEHLAPPTDAWDKYFVMLHALVWLAIAMSLVPVVSGLRVWGRHELRWITKVKFTVVAVSCVVLSWVVVHFHLAGPTRL
jgi:CubicO group peptidase (beta-lactamase class C family)